MIKLTKILYEIKIFQLNSKKIVDLISNIRTDIFNFHTEQGWKKDWLHKKINKILERYNLTTNSLKKNFQELESLNKIKLLDLYNELKKFQDSKDNWERDLFNN